MARNNYNKSSTGTDIECDCSYDLDRRQWEFEENIKIIQHDGYRTTSIGYYIDNGNVECPDKVSFKVKGDKEAKIKYLIDATNFDREEIETWSEETIDEEIIGHENDINLINYALDKLPDVPGLEFVPTKNLIVLTTRGYSQGDYAKVLYCPDDLEKCWGNYPKQEEIQKMVDHYYWDAPIYCLFTINGKEYRYDEMPEYDEYEWDRDKFLDYVAKESAVDRESLEALVPEYPEYN